MPLLSKAHQRTPACARQRTTLCSRNRIPRPGGKCKYFLQKIRLSAVQFPKSRRQQAECSRQQPQAPAGPPDQPQHQAAQSQRRRAPRPAGDALRGGGTRQPCGREIQRPAAVQGPHRQQVEEALSRNFALRWADFHFTTTFSLPKRSSKSHTSEVCRSQVVPMSLPVSSTRMRTLFSFPSNI